MEYLTTRQLIIYGETALNALVLADCDINRYELKGECDFEKVWEECIRIHVEYDNQAESFIIKALLKALFETSCAEFNNIIDLKSEYDDFINERVDWNEQQLEFDY